MGLDMYLYKRNYVKNWPHDVPSDKHVITITRGGKPTAIKPERIAYIFEEVCYWRKANAIHRWFVDECQDGVDECRDTMVSREKIEELLGIVNEILEVPEGPDRDALADELLPPTDGFFFGDTQIGSWYYDCLAYTKRALTDVLSETDDDGFLYTSSW